MAVFTWGGFGWIWSAGLSLAPLRAAVSVQTPMAQQDSDSDVASLPVLAAHCPQPAGRPAPLSCYKQCFPQGNIAFLMSFDLKEVTVTHSALVEALPSFLYKICLWYVSGQHINSCWFPPLLLIFLELRYFISNGYYCYDFGVDDFPIC